MVMVAMDASAAAASHSICFAAASLSSSFKHSRVPWGSYFRGRLLHSEGLFACKRAPRHRRRAPPAQALFGGNTGGDQNKDKKKFITKEEEPEQYWQTTAEKEGKGPMSTVLPYIVIFGFLTPFIILGIAFANGWIKVPVR